MRPTRFFIVLVIALLVLSANVAMANAVDLVIPPVPFAEIPLGQETQLVTPEPLMTPASILPAYDMPSEAKEVEERFNFWFDGVDVRMALQLIAEQTGSNIAIHDDVQGTIHLILNDVTLKQALDTISQIKGLAYVRTDNIYIFTPSNVFPGNNQPVRMNYRLQYLRPNVVEPLLENMFASHVSYVVDETTRTVVFSGPQVAVEAAIDLLEQIDKPQKQVVLMTSVLEITQADMTRLGIQHRDVTGEAPDGPTVSLLNDIVQIFASPVRIMGTLFEIQTELDALSENQRAKVLATPSLAALNGQTASIFLGDNVPIRREAAEGAVEVDWVEVGIHMIYTPWINDNNEVTLDLEAHVESISSWVEGRFPNIVSRDITTTIRAQSGQPIVIGGLFTRNELETMSKIPILGDLPFLGPLFRTKRTDLNESEIVMIIVPYVI